MASIVNSDSASTLLVLMAISGFSFGAVDVCYREPSQVACRESVLVGFPYIIFLIGIHCSLKMRELLYLRVDRIAA